MIVDEGAENHIAPYKSRASNFDTRLKEQNDDHKFLCRVSGKLQDIIKTDFKPHFLFRIILPSRTSLLIFRAGGQFLNMLDSGILENWDATMTIPLTRFYFALVSCG
jgi:hypothetical protein